jgi:hypothetical protein
MLPHPDKFRCHFYKFTFFNDAGKNVVTLSEKNELSQHVVLEVKDQYFRLKLFSLKRKLKKLNK